MQLAHAINLRRGDCRANCRNQAFTLKTPSQGSTSAIGIFCQLMTDLCCIIVRADDSREEPDGQISGRGSTGETVASQDARVKLA